MDFMQRLIYVFFAADFLVIIIFLIYMANDLKKIKAEIKKIKEKLTGE